MDLLLIRHAESLNNANEHIALQERPRQVDPALTPLGHEQARRLAAAFAAGEYPRPDHLYTSPMLRAVQTAAPLADALDLALLTHMEAFEVFGPVEIPDGRIERAVARAGSGRELLQAQSNRLVLPEAVGPEGWWAGPVEDEAAIASRAARVASDLMHRHPGDELVAVVSHGTFGHRLIQHLLGVSEPKVFLRLGNTALTLITGLRQDHIGRPLHDHDLPVVVEYLGRSSHLERGRG